MAVNAPSLKGVDPAAVGEPPVGGGGSQGGVRGSIRYCRYGKGGAGDISARSADAGKPPPPPLRQ